MQEGWCLERVMKELSGVMNVFFVFIRVVVTWANTYVEIYQDVQLRFMPLLCRNFTFMQGVLA